MNVKAAYKEISNQIWLALSILNIFLGLSNAHGHVMLNASAILLGAYGAIRFGYIIYAERRDRRKLSPQ